MSGEGIETAAHIRAQLKREGFACYTDYLIALARHALEHDMLPHINVGNLTLDELTAMRPVVPSMGMMLETVDGAVRGKAAHLRAPDKEPARRLETLRAAGEARVPFTTGLLVGIGETFARVKKRYAASPKFKSLTDTYRKSSCSRSPRTRALRCGIMRRHL
jgi:7,8-didemethyl-8-hydroxy-5-deazariboflavin synthase CofG subunit